MAIRLPKRPSGAKRPKKPSHSASPNSLKLDRSFAQKVRPDHLGIINYESAAKRAQFWARAQQNLAREEEQILNQSVDQISQGTLKQNSQFAVANVREATLSSAAPSVPGQPTIAGIEAGGVAPPPPSVP